VDQKAEAVQPVLGLTSKVVQKVEPGQTQRTKLSLDALRSWGIKVELTIGDELG